VQFFFFFYCRGSHSLNIRSYRYVSGDPFMGWSCPTNQPSFDNKVLKYSPVSKFFYHRKARATKAKFLLTILPDPNLQFITNRTNIKKLNKKGEAASNKQTLQDDETQKLSKDHTTKNQQLSSIVIAKHRYQQQEAKSISVQYLKWLQISIGNEKAAEQQRYANLTLPT